MSATSSTPSRERYAVKKAHLGDLKVSRLGLGAMTMAGTYTSEGGLDDAESIATIHRALDLGVTHIDTAEVYGPSHSEEIVGQAVKGRRDDVVIATKFGLIQYGEGAPRVGVLDSSPRNVRAAVEGSLRRLGTDHIDLYYQHRVDPGTPIEDTVGALAELVTEGKIRYVGLSEAGPDTIRRAHTVHPVTAVQTEYSLWTRDAEAEILPLLRELGVGFVPYSPLGHRLLTGQIRTVDDFADDDWRKTNPRFTGENFRRDPRPDRAGLAAEPRRGHRPDPRHTPDEPGRGEHRRRRRRAEPRPNPPTRQPRARRGRAARRDQHGLDRPLTSNCSCGCS